MREPDDDGFYVVEDSETGTIVARIHQTLQRARDMAAFIVNLANHEGNLAGGGRR